MKPGLQVAGRPEEIIVRKKPIFRVPVWLVLLGLFFKGLWKLARLCVAHPLLTAVTVAVFWLWAEYGAETLAWVVGTVVVVAAVNLAALRWRAPLLFTRYVALPALGRWRYLRVYLGRWANAMRMCNLGKTIDHTTVVPRLVRVVCTEATDRLVVRMLMGQNPEDFHRVAVDIAYSFGARHAQVFEQRPDARPIRVGRLAWLLSRNDDIRWADRPAEVHIVIARRDPLTAVVRPFPITGHVDLTALPLAITSGLEVFTFRLIATHLLVAGASRRGKGSVIWSLIRALAPAVKSGLVRLWVLDPKGGMELAMGRPMFARFAYETWEDMADLLDQAVGVMKDRQRRLAGVVRVHNPTSDEPLIVIVIDEIAAITTYQPDAELRKRIESSLGLLLSQGAGLGVLVVGALQDPRKETLPMRDLFLSRFLLGVTADTHVDMVLGDGMRNRGAVADKLAASAAGVAYVLPDGAADPVKVRFTYLDDGEIKRMAVAYPAPIEPDDKPTVPVQPNGRPDRRGPLLPDNLVDALNDTTGGGK